MTKTLKSSVIVASAMIMTLAFGQGLPQREAPSRSAPPLASGSKAPVTQAEASSAIMKMEGAFRHVVRLEGKVGKTKFPAGATPVTRNQVLAEFDRIFQLLKPKFKIKPKPVQFDASTFTLSDKGAIGSAQTLVGWGCVAKAGPLVAGDSENLNPVQFGDAVGFFIARIAELTHTPSSKYSPYLGGG